MTERTRVRLHRLESRTLALLQRVPVGILLDTGVVAELLTPLSESERDRALELLRSGLSDGGQFSPERLTDDERDELEDLLRARRH